MTPKTREFSIEFAGLCMLASYQDGTAEILLPDVAAIKGSPHHATLAVKDHVGIAGNEPQTVVTIPGVRDEFAVYNIEHCELLLSGATDKKLSLNLSGRAGRSTRRTVKQLPDVGEMSGSKAVTGKASYVRVPITVGRVSALKMEPKDEKFAIRFGPGKFKGPFVFVQRLEWTVQAPGPIVLKLVGPSGERTIRIDPAECSRICCANICASHELTGPNHFLAYYEMLENPKDKPLIVPFASTKKRGAFTDNVPTDPPHCDPSTVLRATRAT